MVVNKHLQLSSLSIYIPHPIYSPNVLQCIIQCMNTTRGPKKYGYMSSLSFALHVGKHGLHL